MMSNRGLDPKTTKILCHKLFLQPLLMRFTESLMAGVTAISISPRKQAKHSTVSELKTTNQSPRQKWNSTAFKAANTQLKLILNNPDSKAQMEADYEAAKHIASNGKAYSTLRAWKFNSLLHEYKLSHPFVQP